MKKGLNLKKELVCFIEGINENNFNSSYQNATDLIRFYQDKGVTKDGVLKILNEVDEEMQMNIYQEEVYLELCSRVEGFCAEKDNIDWN